MLCYLSVTVGMSGAPPYKILGELGNDGPAGVIWPADQTQAEIFPGFWSCPGHHLNWSYHNDITQHTTRRHFFENGVLKVGHLAIARLKLAHICWQGLDYCWETTNIVMRLRRTSYQMLSDCMAWQSVISLVLVRSGHSTVSPTQITFQTDITTSSIHPRHPDDVLVTSDDRPLQDWWQSRLSPHASPNLWSWECDVMIGCNVVEYLYWTSQQHDSQDRRGRKVNKSHPGNYQHSKVSEG